MNRTTKIFFALGAGLFTGLLIMICLLQLMGFVWSNDIVMESCQGEYIKYNSYDPYCVYIIKQSQPLSSDYIIMISHKGSHTYGHVLNYVDPLVTSEEEVKKTRVIWSEQGIELTFPAGHKLYVPKEKFIGGR